MNTPTYLLYKMPHVSTDLWLPTLRDRSIGEDAPAGKLLWLKNGNKVTRVAPPCLLHVFENEDNSYQWVMYRAKDNLVPKLHYKLKYEGKHTMTIIGDIDANLPGFMDKVEPIEGFDNLYSVPDTIAEQFLSDDEHTGNIIGGNAKVTQSVKLAGGHINITGNADIDNSTIETLSVWRGGAPHRIEDYTIRNSTVYIEGDMMGTGSVTASTLRKVRVISDNDTPVSLISNDVRARDVDVKNGTLSMNGISAESLGVEGGANVTVAGHDVQLHHVYFNQGSFNISGSLSIASAVFASGNLHAKITHRNHHNPYTRSGGRWLTICPNNHVHYSLAGALNPPYSRWGNVHTLSDATGVSLLVAADIKYTKATVEQYCVAPDAHATDPHCRCGLFFGLLLLGSSEAVEYFARAAGIKTRLTERYQVDSKEDLEVKLYSILDEVAKRRDNTDLFGRLWNITSSGYNGNYFWKGSNCVEYIKELTGLTDIGVLAGETLED